MIGVVRWLGRILLAIAALFILTGIGGTWWFQGFDAVMDLLSPFNIVNWLLTVVVLAPGLGLMTLADRMERKARERAG